MVIMGKKGKLKYTLQCSYMDRRGEEGLNSRVAQLYTQQHPVSLKPIRYTEQHISLSLQSSINCN